MDQSTKACPFCGEQVLAVAIKCKHCGSKLPVEGKPSAGSRIKIALAAVVLVAAAAGGTWSALRPKELPRGFEGVDVGMKLEDALIKWGKPAESRDAWNEVSWRRPEAPRRVLLHYSLDVIHTIEMQETGSSCADTVKSYERKYGPRAKGDIPTWSKGTLKLHLSGWTEPDCTIWISDSQYR